MIRAYLGWPEVQQFGHVALFRTREGAAYRKNSVAADFRRIRGLVEQKECRQMLDIRSRDRGQSRRRLE